jgi:hypothetical protein
MRLEKPISNVKAMKKDNEDIGPLVDKLQEIDQELFLPFLVYKHGEKVISVFLIKVLYGTLVAALLFYKQPNKDLESIGFQTNPIDPHAANRVIDNSKSHLAYR